MKRKALLLAVMVVTFTSGCSKLAALAKEKEEPPADDAAAATASAAATTAAPASAAPTTTAKPTSTAAVVAKQAKAALAAPSPTTDRFPRNRDKDGPCPGGFVEQPGVEQHSTCARACKSDTNCHGHTCVDSDVGNGKVCSEIASKVPAASAAKTPIKCKPNELDDGDRCLTTCTEDKDCARIKGTSCQQIKVPNPNGGTSTGMVCQ